MVAAGRTRSKATAPERHSLPLGLARLGGRPLMASKLTDAEITSLRDPNVGRGLTCVSCRVRVRVGRDDDGRTCFFHTTKAVLSHDPETITHFHAVRALAARTRELFGSAQIVTGEPFSELGYLADIVAVSGHGLRLAAEIQEAEISREEYERITNGLEDEGIAVLWLRSPGLLRLTGAKGRPVRRMTLGEVETAILAQGRTLMYLAPDQATSAADALAASAGRGRPDRKVGGRGAAGVPPAGERIPKLLVVEPHPAALQLAALGERRIGQVEVVLRRYPLSQLRVHQGELCVLTDYDADPPVFGEPSAAIARKLSRYATP